MQSSNMAAQGTAELIGKSDGMALAPSPSPPGYHSREQSLLTVSTSAARTQPRRQITAACRACRKRKSKCDGLRPTCTLCTDKTTHCTYSVEQGKTQQQASREQLKAYKAVVKMLRIATPGETDVILRHLREQYDVDTAVRAISDGALLMEGRVDRRQGEM